MAQAGVVFKGSVGYSRAQTVQILINSLALELVVLSMLFSAPSEGPMVVNPVKTFSHLITPSHTFSHLRGPDGRQPRQDQAHTQCTPRTVCTFSRCSADAVHRVWHRCLTPSLAALAAQVKIVASGALTALITVPGMLVFAISFEPILFIKLPFRLLRMLACAPYRTARLCVRLCAGRRAAEQYGKVGRRAAHGALPHRAPPTRCTAESMHRVWVQVGRRSTWGSWGGAAGAGAGIGPCAGAGGGAPPVGGTGGPCWCCASLSWWAWNLK